MPVGAYVEPGGLNPQQRGCPPLGFTPHIRSRGEEARELRKDLGERARRWVVERVHSWINRYRAMLIRWSKKPINHEALLMFCFALITWQQMGILG